jgi:nucleotide-binding universal stress UspA family protein
MAEVVVVFRHIVVPTDGSERSLDALVPASNLARALGIEIDIVSAGPRHRGHVRELHIKEVAAQQDAPVRVVSIVDSDDPVAVVSDHLRSVPDALVVMTTHGHTGIEAVLIGSVAERLLRAITGPVLLVGPRCATSDPTQGAVLVPTDGSSASMAVLEPLAGLVRALPAPPDVWVVSVSPPQEFSAASQMPSEDIDEAAAARRVAARIQEELGIAPQWDVLHSSKPATVLADMARRLPAGLIAMSTHGRSGLARMTMGSVTMATVRHAPCPVLVVRPERLRDR